jgi:tetratricopeptide (TPR) repeat protein
MNTQAENGSLSTASPQAGDAAAFVRQGFQLAGQQRLDEAVASFERAVAVEPGFAEAWIGRGIVLFYLGRLEEAVASYDRVLALRPDAEAFNNRALALYTLDRFDEAVASYDQALALKPDAQAFNIRGMALHKLRRFEEAVASYDRALALKPGYAEVFNSRAAALAKLGRHDRALESIDQAIALEAGSAEICLIVGVDLHNCGRFDDALACYDRALALKPDYADAHFHRALILLSSGDFARGFEDYRWRFRIEDERRRPSRPEGITCPDWEGEPLAGKRLVVFVEQGFGDALQFVRYVPMATARGARVTLFAPAALLTLLRASLPGVEVTDTLPGNAVFDYQAPMLDLPRLFGTTLDTVPAQVPYLLADHAAAEAWAQRLAALPATRPGLTRPELNVGLVWAGSSRLPDIDARRSLKLAQLAPLADMPGIRFVSLQIGEPAAEAKAPSAGLQLIDWTSEIRNYADTAALIAGLDLVITVDTSVAHLAGGLGKPVWILSRFDGCWRWLMGREDSPWYPTARLFHQPVLGDWDSVIAQAATALQAFAAQAATLAAAADPHPVGDAVALVRQGLQLAERQRFDDALANFDQANALAPDFAEAWICRGIVLAHLGRLDDAAASYGRALALKPDAEIFGNRGAALYRLGRFEEAAASYANALALEPDAQTFHSRGAALYHLGRFDQALESYDGALALKPDYAEVFNSRAAALVKLARFDEALESIDRAIALGSGSAEVCQGIGLGFHHLGRLDDALACYDRALAIEPDRADTRYNRAVTLLRAGDLARGFEDYRWRFRIPGARPTRPDWLACPDWEGEPIAGKRLVVFVEQGYGDTLQFVRYVPMAQALGARVTLFVPPTLTRLLRASLPGVEVVDRLPETAVFDYQAPMLCLPRIFRTTLDTIPAATPYLLADPAAAASWARRLAALPDLARPGLARPELKVGLVWAGGKEQSYDARRSLKLDQFAPLAAIPGIQFVSLQLGEPAEEAKAPPAGLKLADWTGEISDFADTAALIANLDLVITVDTSAAHLAGALGKPVWILSRFDGCWRWLLGRNDSPWYPTARLFHQPATEQWDPVVADVAAALQAFSAQHAAMQPELAAEPAAGELPAAIPPQSDDDAVAFARYGLQLNYRRRFDEAVASFDKAVALDADFIEAWISRGIALFALGRFGEAVASYDRALALAPDAEVFNIRGLALYMLGRLDDAIPSYDRALALRPDYADAQLNRAQALLRAGDLAHGFEAYHWRFRIDDRPARPDWLACPEWQGEPIAGKRLVIFHEQGFGDSLQFVRYVPMALARGAQVTLFVPPALARLLRASLPGVEVVDSLPRNAVFDFQAPMLGLPQIFGTTLDTIPAEIPYLAVDQAAAAAWAQRLAALPGCKVGLVWAGGKDRAYDEYRSLTLARFAPFAAVPGVQFINLQLGESAAEAKMPPAGLKLIDWTNEIGDYADTAALIAGLDLVVTVCTSVAHLAGALGRPVWILLHEGCCWRWLMNREDSPWYPTARLFRQPAVGQWSPVIAEAAAALRAFASKPETLEPESAQACRSAGLALHRRGQLDDALVYYDRALALETDAETLNARGAALYELGRCGEAIASYDRALALKPDLAEIQWNRTRALLRAGDLARGFDAYRQCVERHGDLTAFACPLWQGEPLAGKRLLVFSEYGHGDTLQFVRYVPMAQALGARVTLLVEPALLRLLRASLPGVEVVDNLLSNAVFDFQVAMLCLPSLFGTTLDTIPAQAPYLAVDQSAAASWAQRLAALPDPTLPDLKIGLVWAGAKDRSYDARRSLTLAQLAPLAAIPGMRFVSLQLGESAAQAKAPPAGLELVDWTAEISDYADTAALVAGLDLVIAVDTSVAHLAGALGKPVWILSRFDGCWRWLLDREDSPWYPTARLFHQSATGGWDPVMANVASALRKLASSPAIPEPAADAAAALVNHGVQLAYEQRFDEALASFDQAIALKPDLVEARLNRGIALFYLGRVDEALAGYDSALALQPDWAEALNHRAAALAKLGRLEQALESADRAITLGSDSAEICQEIGLALYRRDRLDEALACYDRALALKPDWVEALNSRSVILDTLGRCDEALAGYDRVLALEPDRAQAQWNRTRVLLRAGDLARGFDAYRRCLQRHGEPSALACPEWQGEPIAGKRLVVFSEHGYGDTLQFIRYAPMAAALGAQVTVLVRPALTRLLRASLPGIEVIDGLRGDAAFDYQVAMLCLPSLLHTTLDTIPAPVPYLHADPAAAASWAQRLAALPGLTRPGLTRPGRKVGLVWAGNKERSNDAHRSLKLAQFAALANIAGVQFVSLQLGEPAEEAKTPPAGLALTDWTSELADYADTAALVAGLDAVISVCTSVAHLAGAMGKPVWIPLHYDSCWRWLLNRGDSPWYPTARLFRQPAMGAWEPAMADLAAALRTFASKNALE